MVVKALKSRPTLSWCLYDWANSVLATIIFTFVFSVYFARGVVGDETLASAYWGYAIGIAGLVVAILSPILGVISDSLGPRKPILFALTSITIISTALMYWVQPDPSYAMMALILVGIATIGFELAQAQYNAMLFDIAPKNKLGRISGQAWALGYFGGLVCLVIALIGFIGLGGGTGLLGLSQDNSLNIRSTCLLAAGWYAIFALPLFLYVPDRPNRLVPKHNIARNTLITLKNTVQNLFKQDKNIGLFLLSSAIYRDGLNTLFTVGGLYAAGTFGMDFQEILIFAIGLNITSGLGAYAFSYIDDKWGAKETILLSLVALILLGIGIIIVEDKTAFMILALLLGLFIGPVQSSSRSMMARLASKENSTELFGLYAMTGKSIAFTGPLAFAFLTQTTDSQRIGITAIIVLWVVGALILLRVKSSDSQKT